ncbi:MAG TPA: CPBP family intramembrane glutamic endopeptidase [Chitinophagaceae bacterium]|jgi:hypothetical protein
METPHNKKSLIHQGWLRALLFTLFYFLLLFLAGMVLQLILGNGDAQGNTNGQFFIRFIVNAALSVLAVWVFRTVIDRKSLMSLGLAFSKNGAHAGAGFFLGVLMVCGGTLVLSWTSHLEWTGSVFNGNDLFISLGLMAIVAVYEELVFRGYLLNNLMDSMNKWVALLISALLFALAHTGNPGFSFLPALNIFVAGLLLGVNYIYTRNCWFGILLHFSWNFFQGPILGYEVSGVHLQSLFQHDIKGSTWLTGGEFGLEGSIIALLVYLLALAGLVLVYEKKFRPRVAA